MKKETFLSVGKIVGTHGIRGVVRLHFYGESPFLFKLGDPILLQLPDGEKKIYTVSDMHPHKRLFLLSLREVRDMETAESLQGAEFLVERSLLPEPEEGSYYCFDLIGISVFAENDRYLGQIESIFPTGSNDVYVVRDGKKEILIPAIASVITDISLENRKMLVVLPEGLES